MTLFDKPKLGFALKQLPDFTLLNTVLAFELFYDVIKPDDSVNVQFAPRLAQPVGAGCCGPKAILPAPLRRVAVYAFCIYDRTPDATVAQMDRLSATPQPSISTHGNDTSSCPSRRRSRRALDLLARFLGQALETLEQRGDPVMSGTSTSGAWMFLVPVFVLGLGNGTVSEVTRHLRGHLETVLTEDYIRTARAKGARLWRHLYKDGFVMPLSSLRGKVPKGTAPASSLLRARVRPYRATPLVTRPAVFSTLPRELGACKVGAGFQAPPCRGQFPTIGRGTLFISGDNSLWL